MSAHVQTTTELASVLDEIRTAEPSDFSGEAVSHADILENEFQLGLWKIWGTYHTDES